MPLFRQYAARSASSVLIPSTGYLISRTRNHACLLAVQQDIKLAPTAIAIPKAALSTIPSNQVFFTSLAGEKLNGVQVNPTSQQEMRENVEKVLQFVASKKIRMHQTSAKGTCPLQLPHMILAVEHPVLFLPHIKQKQIMRRFVGEVGFSLPPLWLSNRFWVA